ncbi:MAG: hypothetical protein M1819_002887 [Sarea resinae]|nr:MAG: hypothetical protein M1819_002887 [Sarea resinae]
MSHTPDQAEVGNHVHEVLEEHGEMDDDKSGRVNVGTDEEPSRLVEWLREEQERNHGAGLETNGDTFHGYGKLENAEEDSIDDEPAHSPKPGSYRPPSVEGAFSTPDDTPSRQGSVSSTPSSSAFISRQSPTPSLRPFDRRFQSRLSLSPLDSPRALSPAFLNIHSRQSSLSSQLFRDQGDAETPPAPWEVMRWTRLRKISGQAFSEGGKRNFGRPSCISVSTSIVVGTSKGIILIFDYHQTLKSIIGQGTKAVEAGAITSLAISADHTTVAGGHVNGSIFTWEIARSARPFLHIPSIDSAQLLDRKDDGHVFGAAVLHIGFLGTRRTALVSADNRGMAFSHLATRGLGAVGRTVVTTRILGRYPSDMPSISRPRKPSSVLAFSPLPLGNAEQSTDSLGLVAMLTPYLLVIVSTTPIAQTQHKAARPKQINEQSTMSGCLAWFPSVKLKLKDPSAPEAVSKPKLVYCWSNILTVLEVNDVSAHETADRDRPPSLQFHPRSRWRADEAIAAVQWISRSVLAVLTITQRLIILEDNSMRTTESLDLMQRQIFHQDLFSRQLQPPDIEGDVDNTFGNGPVADAFYMSLRAYKGRIFLLGFLDIWVGTLSNWADRLLALMEEGDYVGAIELATAYYIGEGDKLTVGLPEDDMHRHSMVQEKLIDMMSASLKYVFGSGDRAGARQTEKRQLDQLAASCLLACISMDDTDFLFDEVYERYSDSSSAGVFLEALEPYILDSSIQSVPPTVIKDLINHYVSKGLEARMEEMICHLDTRTMDLDQITTMCRKHKLYDALIYVWNRAMGDYITPLIELLSLLKPPPPRDTPVNGEKVQEPYSSVYALKIFPYLSYALTSRIYPNGETLPELEASKGKAQIYYFLFSGRTIAWPKESGKPVLTRPAQEPEPSFPYLRMILQFDAPSLLSALNEAFEDSFLNGERESMVNGGTRRDLGDDEVFGLSVNRQFIVSILLEVLSPQNFGSEDTIYLAMFIARNLPKFPQFILLPGTTLHRVLLDLCEYPSIDIADDCQLSVEYLMSMYHPPDLTSLVPRFRNAGFYRVLKSLFKEEKRYADLLQTYFDDHDNQQAIFECIGDCLRPRTGLNDRQSREVRSVIIKNARELANIDTSKTAMAIAAYAPDLHQTMLDALSDNPCAQFEYLRTILEPEDQSSGVFRTDRETPNHAFVEQYVRLMCEYDRSHVADYINLLQSGDLRLEEVLPAIENTGVVDAAVVLMAREGKVRQAMDRLIQHFGTLEAALMGVLGVETSDSNRAEADESAQDLAEAIHKYTQVGIWLCQNHMKTVLKSKTVSTGNHGKGLSSAKQEMSNEELLWLDLIDTVVGITKNASAAIQQKSDSEGSNADTPSSPSIKLTGSLRTAVQQTFTALLATTSQITPKATPNGTAVHTDFSFLRILQAFLARASLSSPSLSDLRGVLATIFSAYAYEESILALANRLLDKDLFVHVTEAADLRQRGWRARDQTCEGCNRKVWGPGVGGNEWHAWEKRREAERKRKARRRIQQSQGLSSRSLERGKGRATSDVEGDPISIMAEAGGMHLGHGTAGEDENEAAMLGGGPEGNAVVPMEDLGPLIVFACGHVVHTRCLETLRVAASDGAITAPTTTSITTTSATAVGSGAHNDPGESGLGCPTCR